MTSAPILATTPEPAPLADYLAGVLASLRPLPAREVDLTQSYGGTLAEEVRAPSALPAFDHASIDGYAARTEDLFGAGPQQTVRLRVVGDVTAASARPDRLLDGGCVAVAAGAPLPPGADVVVPPAWTDQDTAAVEIRWRPRRGHGVRRAGDEIKAGAALTAPGTPLTPAMIAVLAATGVTRVAVRPQPRVALIATGDELVEPGVASQPGQLVDVNSPALAAAAAEAGASPYRAGICADNQDALRTLVAEQAGKADLIVTSGGSGTGPGDLVRRALGADGGVRFTEVSLFPCSVVGFGMLPTGGGRAARVPVLCLPGDPGSALIGFEVLVRPMIQKLAGAEPFRRSARAHLLDTLLSPLGRREFRPAQVAERRGGGYTARPLSGGPYTLSGMALANGLIVLGERVGRAPAGSTVDVLLLDRRR